MAAPEFDAVIVGAGIAGASFAYTLAPHAKVLLLERETQPGMHSTGRSAAMFMESYGPAQVRALTRASRAFYESPPAGFSEAPMLQPRGALYAAWQSQEAALDELHATLETTGSVVSRLDVEACLRRVPVLRADGLLGGVFESDAMDIDVHALHQGFLRAAKRAGAVVWTDAELTQADNHGGTWQIALTDSRRACARTLIDAAGAWADEVARRCGVAPLGIQPKRRSAFTFAAPAGLDIRAWPTVCNVQETWYIKPDAGQLLGSPANADPVPAHDVVAEEFDIASGIAAIEADTTLSIRRPTRTWAGLRSFAPDGELVIGWDAQRPAFFWLAGQGGYGIQSAAGAAQLAAALWLGTPLPDALLREGVQVHAVEPARLARAALASSARSEATGREVRAQPARKQTMERTNVKYVIDIGPRPSLPVAGSDARFPVGRIYCVGRNYAEHAREMGHDPDREPPFFFMKAANSIVQNNATIAYPVGTKDVHHEIEMVVAIGKGGKNIAPDKALDHVWGYAVGLDMTRRDIQGEAKKMGRPWEMGKSFDESAPVTALRPASEIGHPAKGAITLKVNGQIKQTGDLSMQIWGVAEQISYLSNLITLQPGDLIFSGTPAGVGPIKPGDKLEGHVDGVGDLTVTYKA